MKKPKTYSKDWPYYDSYKGYELEIFHDGSVNIVNRQIEPSIILATHKDLTAAFTDINKTVECLNKKDDMSLTIQDFAKAKYALEKANVPMTSCWMSYDASVSFAPSTPQVCNSVPCVNVAESNCQKGNNPMYVNNDKHIESAKINYLSDRVQTVFYSKETPLMKQFGLTDDEAPKTAQEFVDRIVSGKYTFKDATKKDSVGYYYRTYEGIRWRDPAVKEDKAGYDAAYAAFLKVYQDTKDTIAIGTPVEGLAAVKALDAWTAPATAQ